MSEQVRCPNKALLIDRENAHRAYWLLKAPHTHTPDDVQDPEYFGLQADRLKVFDMIEVMAEDLSWYVELVVRAVPKGTHQVVTQLLTIKRFDAADLPEGWTVEYLGINGRHTIMRAGEKVEGGFASREDAVERAIFLAEKEATPRRKAGAQRAVAAA